MNYNTDGFNERSIYIHNSLDKGKKHAKFDNSFAQMRALEHKNDVATVNSDKIFTYKEIRGNKENFILRNAKMSNSEPKGNLNPLFHNNMFKN